MKQNIVLIVLIFFVVTLGSCRKENNKTAIPLTHYSSYGYDDVYGVVSIMSHGRIGKNNRYYQLSGHFSDMELGLGGEAKDAGDLSINSNLINQSIDYSYGSDNQSLLQGLYADTVLNISLSGNPLIDIPAYSFALVRPDDLDVNLIGFSKTSGIELTWNASVDSGAMVSILVNDVDVNSKEFFKMVPDNGAYSISSADLTPFISGERLEIVVSRTRLSGETISINGIDKTLIAEWVTYQSETYVLQP